MNTVRRFLLDQDFPLLMADAGYWPGVTLDPLRDVHRDLTENHDDWQVLAEISRRGGYDGFITLDSAMLNQPKEMVVLHQSLLKLIVIDDGGNDPLVATGLLMAYMPQILKRFDESKPQLWIVRPGERKPTNPWDQITAIANHRGANPRQLRTENLVPWDELGLPPRTV